MSIADENLKWCGAEPHSEGTDYGIRTYGPDGKAVQFLEVAGEFSEEEVAAIIQYLELVKNKRS